VSNSDVILMSTVP